ncbi:hypothetical protein GCM10011504_41570 [Siccirubricoccus deserti]|uniref:DUF2628 domain-containing protein n=1 Tax=Siccirubricoccus deserti TaxID=2013562 RepID=A0A9X0R0S3_9PROT|nr:DUF2628 domain-containing protein [Siccirubricoccus deserti]MBC4017420.1 DUF2628 domain-containing protein [Siccirubricoccus deserti]GGC59037.1 hypothetical protein GCM10011504_41570 [Siccirubricoccus deserti]
MRVWTVHIPSAAPAAAGQAPVGGPAVLLRQGFAWGAFLLGPLWLLRHRLWLEAVIWLGLALLLSGLAPAWTLPPAILALQFLLGASAQDLRAAALARRGLPEALVVAAEDLDHALARLLRARPDLAPALARTALA